MNELSKALTEFGGEKGYGTDALEKAAIKWAMFVLKTHNKKLRKRGMQITFAIHDYIDAFRVDKGGGE